MNILKSLGHYLFRVLVTILLSVALVVAVAIALPFGIIGILLVGFFAPASWFDPLCEEVDPDLVLD